MTFAGARIAVFGLGRSGLATCRSLIEGGADVAAWDDGPAARASAATAGVPLVDLATADWRRFDSLILSPGVPLTHPVPHWTVERAKAAGVEIIGDVEIFFRERARFAPDAPVVCITGTNGKSTTTALIAHLARAVGADLELGGNIGVPILDLRPPAPGRVHVIEMSSYQIDLTPSLAPSIGILLNVTPDHIDRHGTFEHYAEVKSRLIANSQAAVIAVDDAITRGIYEERLDAHSVLYPVTSGRGSAIVPRIYAIGATLFVHESQGAYASSEEIASLDGAPALRGAHNVQNAAAALGAMRALEDRRCAAAEPYREPCYWQPKLLNAALHAFPGLPHRMEQVGLLEAPNGARVLIVNDSKATNADSTEKALAAFAGGIFWIVGGKAKEGGIAPLAPYFSRVQRAYLIGEAATPFAATLAGHVPATLCVTIDVALAHALADAVAAGLPEAVILLSPACASFDQFKSFEHRGDAFRDLARAALATDPITRTGTGTGTGNGSASGAGATSRSRPS